MKQTAEVVVGGRALKVGDILGGKTISSSLEYTAHEMIVHFEGGGSCTLQKAHDFNVVRATAMIVPETKK